MKSDKFIAQLEQRILKLIAERDQAIERAEKIERENISLKKKLAFYEGPNVPPSVETLKTKMKKVEKSKKKKRGAPKGHRGATRKIPEPDKIIPVPAACCPRCDQDPGEPIGTKKNIIEELVTPPKIEVIQYDLDIHECQHCNLKFTAKHEDCPTKGNFGVNLLVYSTMLKFHLRGVLRKVQDFLFHYNGFKISTKGLMDMLLRVGDTCKSEYNRTIMKIRSADWVHIDETGISINGEKWWIWIFRTKNNDILVVIRKSRGQKVVKEILGDDFKGAVIVDGWKAYHYLEIIQRCWAHLLRKVDDYINTSKNGLGLSKEIHAMFNKLKEFLDKDPPVDTRRAQKQDFERKMKKLVDKYCVFDELHVPITYIKNALDKWYTCLLYPGMEPTNNLGEQATREHVIMRKIIGCFRSENGSQNYQYIASLLATWRLQDKNIFVELENLLRRELCLS